MRTKLVVMLNKAWRSGWGGDFHASANCEVQLRGLGRIL